MLPHVLRDLEHVQTHVFWAASLGERAIGDAVDDCRSRGLPVRLTRIEKTGPGRYRVHVAIHGLDQLMDLDDPTIQNPTYALASQFILARQAQLPPHLAGLPHNATQDQAEFVLRYIRESLDYTLSFEDFWVHHDEANQLLAFGAVTRSGVLAFRRLLDRLFPNLRVEQGLLPWPSPDRPWLAARGVQVEAPAVKIVSVRANRKTGPAAKSAENLLEEFEGLSRLFGFPS